LIVLRDFCAKEESVITPEMKQLIIALTLEYRETWLINHDVILIMILNEIYDIPI